MVSLCLDILKTLTSCTLNGWIVWRVSSETLKSEHFIFATAEPVWAAILRHSHTDTTCTETCACCLLHRVGSESLQGPVWFLILGSTQIFIVLKWHWSCGWFKKAKVTSSCDFRLRTLSTHCPFPTNSIYYEATGIVLETPPWRPSLALVTPKAMVR